MSIGQHRTRQEGFALILVAALFTAFALIAEALIDRSNSQQRIQEQSETAAQLDRIAWAIVQFSIFNSNRYPCPAALNVSATDAAFGTPIATCHSAVAAGTPPNFVALTTETIRGMVPVVALAPYGITFSDAFDLWNNRIFYIVDRQLTPGGTGTASSIANRPTVVESNLNQTFRQPHFMVISYGRDGVGGIPRSGTAIAIACPAASAVRREENCDDDRVFLKMPVRTASGVANADYFDDILVFYGI